MAKIEFKGLDDYRKRISDIGLRADAACKYAVYDAAALVCDAIKEATPVSNDKRSSGDLKDSVKLTAFREEEGFIYTKVIFDGFDSKKAPNPVKARVLESGTSDGRVPKHPFIRKTVNRVRERAEAIMQQNLDHYFEQIMRK